MKYNIVGLLIAVDHPINSISNLIAIGIKFLIQYLLTVDDLNIFKGIFQGLYIYNLKDIVLKFHR